MAQDLQTARAHQARGDNALAITLFERVLAAEPENYEAQLYLAAAQINLQRFQEGYLSAQRALALRPGAAQAHALVGEAAGWVEQYDAAVGHLSASLVMEPANWAVLARLSGILFWLDRSGEMIPWLERAVAARPGLAAAHQMLGTLKLGMGDLEEARKSLERAVALEPYNPRYRRLLGEAITYVAGERRLSALEQMATAEMPAEARAERDFALAKAYRDIGRHDDAHRHTVAANRAVRATFEYDEARTLAAFAHTMEVFTPEFLAERAGTGLGSERPVFIVGMPRSGSTLVEQILAAHPAIHGAGESRALPRAIAPFVQNFPDDVAALGRLQFEAMAERYLGTISADAGSAARVTDKMLPNFLLLGLIHLMLPQARIIHVVRDPVDTCLSIFATHFEEAQPYAYDLGETGRYYAAYSKLMAHWHSVLPPGRILDIRYEAVVADIEGMARRMTDHVGLAFDPACLDFTAARRPVWTASAAQVRKPLYRSAIGRSRPPEEILRPLLDALG